MKSSMRSDPTASLATRVPARQHPRTAHRRGEDTPSPPNPLHPRFPALVAKWLRVHAAVRSQPRAVGGATRAIRRVARKDRFDGMFLIGCRNMRELWFFSSRRKLSHHLPAPPPPRFRCPSPRLSRSALHSSRSPQVTFFPCCAPTPQLRVCLPALLRSFSALSSAHVSLLVEVPRHGSRRLVRRPVRRLCPPSRVRPPLTVRLDDRGRQAAVARWRDLRRWRSGSQ